MSSPSAKPSENPEPDFVSAYRAPKKTRGPTPISLEKQLDTWLANNPGKVGGRAQDPAAQETPAVAQGTTAAPARSKR